MVICRFFLQGNCRFGNNCWNEHITEGAKHRFGTEHFKKYHYESEKFDIPNNTPHLPFYMYAKDIGFSFNQTLKNVEPNSKFEVIYDSGKLKDSTCKEFQPDELKNIKEDVISWSEGHMWPFTCYSPRNRNGLTCFKDISPEELRWDMIEAEKSGTLQAYLKNINETLTQINSRREQLKNPTNQILESLSNNESNTSGKNFQNKQSVLAQTSFKLPENDLKVFSSPMNGQNNKFNLSSFSGRQSSQQFPFANNNQQNSFTSSNSAKSFSFTLAAAEAETEMNAFSADSASSEVAMLNNINRNSVQNFAEKPTSSKDKYSELYFLNKDEKEQFIGPKFVLGMIPTKPPPIELCF